MVRRCRLGKRTGAAARPANRESGPGVTGCRRNAALQQRENSLPHDYVALIRLSRPVITLGMGPRFVKTVANNEGWMESKSPRLASQSLVRPLELPCYTWHGSLFRLHHQRKRQSASSCWAALSAAVINALAAAAAQEPHYVDAVLSLAGQESIGPGPGRALPRRRRARIRPRLSEPDPGSLTDMLAKVPAHRRHYWF